MRKSRFLAVLAVLGLLLSACSSLPRSGDVHAVNPSKNEGGNVALVGQPPPEGATPQEIVDYFLVACRAGGEDDYAVARQYLMPSTSADWDPKTEVRVYPESQNIQTTVTESGGVRARVSSLGTLSETGIYTESANNAVFNADFSLAKNQEGEWRIVNLDNGIFLAERMFFGQLYAEAPVYFLASATDSLVADLHWFPRREAPSRALHALLSGPSPWLSDGVTSAVPEDTRLTKNLQIDDGVAHVELSPNVLAIPQRQRSLMLAQVRSTLLAFSSIQSVQISVPGEVLDKEVVLELSDYPYGSYPLSVISGGVPGTVVDQDEIESVPANPAFADLGLTDLAVAYQKPPSSYAALARSGTELVAIDGATGNVRTLTTGASLIAPSFDSLGWIWSGERANNGSLTVSTALEMEPLTVAAPGLQGMNVRDFAVSREGSRIVIVAESGSEVKTYVASITRSAEGVPTSLGDLIQIGRRLADVTDVSWVGATELMALGRSAAGSDTSLYSLRLGGPTGRAMNVQEGTLALTSTRSSQPVVILTESGRVFERDGSSWRNRAASVSSVAYPG